VDSVESSLSELSLSESVPKNGTSEIIDDLKRSSIYCFSITKWTKLTPAIFFVLVLAGFYLINVVTSMIAIQRDVQTETNKVKKIGHAAWHLPMYLSGLIIGVLLFKGIMPIRFFPMLFLSVPGIGLLALKAEILSCQENVEKDKPFFHARTETVQEGEVCYMRQRTGYTKAGSMAFRLISSEIYLFQSAFLSTFAIACKMHMYKRGAYINNTTANDFIKSASLLNSSNLNLSLLMVSSVFNVIQIIHAWVVYYKTRYVKYAHNCKKDILYTETDNDEDVALSKVQKFYTLPMIVFSTVTDHIADFTVIVFYMKIGIQGYKQNGDWQILNWGIMSGLIWLISNCAQMRIHSRRLKDVQQEDKDLEMLSISRMQTTAIDRQSTVSRVKKTVLNHLVSFVFGPIINVINLYRTVPHKGLVSYRGVIY
jgi:hypothetical protein